MFSDLEYVINLGIFNSRCKDDRETGIYTCWKLSRYTFGTVETDNCQNDFKPRDISLPESMPDIQTDTNTLEMMTKQIIRIVAHTVWCSTPALLSSVVCLCVHLVSPSTPHTDHFNHAMNCVLPPQPSQGLMLPNFKDFICILYKRNI